MVANEGHNDQKTHAGKKEEKKRRGIMNTSSAVPSCLEEDTRFVPDYLVLIYNSLRQCSTFIAFFFAQEASQPVALHNPPHIHKS